MSVITAERAMMEYTADTRRLPHVTSMIIHTKLRTTLEGQGTLPKADS